MALNDIIKFKLVNVDNWAILPNLKKAWVSFHVTKHFIQNFESEGYNKQSEVKLSDINTIQKMQIDNFNCKVLIDNTIIQTDSCGKCSFLDKCYKAISINAKAYFKLISNTLQEDVKQPRHAIYRDKEKRHNNLLLINNSGYNTIAAKTTSHNEFRVVTHYRSLNPTDKLDLAFLKILGDDRWHLIKTKERWNIRFSNINKYSSCKKVLKTNWE